MSSGQLVVLFGFVVLLVAALLLFVPIYSGRLARKSGADRSIAVPGADLAAGRLPMVCARTGGPAESTVQERSDLMSPAVAVSLAFGPIAIVLLIVGWAVAKKKCVVAEIPLSSSARVARDQTTKRATVVAVGASLLALGATVLAASWSPGWVLVAVAVLALTALAAAVVFAVQARMSRVRIRRDHDDELVFLDGVHPDFVERVQRHAATH